MYNFLWQWHAADDIFLELAVSLPALLETELLFKLPAVNIGKKVPRANVCPNGRKCLHFVCSVHKLDESNSLAPLASTPAWSSEGQAEAVPRSTAAIGRKCACAVLLTCGQPGMQKSLPVL